MLKGIDYIGGTGLFFSSGASPDFGRVTLIYGENGRGKSTLSAVLRSCAENDSAQLLPRKTLGEQINQSASLRFDTDAGAITAVLADGTWSNAAPEIAVFDADFVARNVYAGSEITSDQRAHLLSFALGEEAVTARVTHDGLNTQLHAANTTLRQAAAAVDSARASLSLDAYRALPADEHADQKIAELSARLHASQAIESIRARPIGTDLAVPTLLTEQFFEILRAGLPAVAEDAEARVREHMAGHNTEGFENWLSAGLAYATDASCPFCASDVSTNNLIAAYRTHFNSEYQQHKSRAATLERDTETRISAVIADRLEREFQTAHAQQALWRETVALQSLNFDAQAIRADLLQLRQLLLPLATKKAGAPLESLGTADEEVETNRIWNSILEKVRSTNSEIEANRQLIATYKAGLEGENAATIQTAILALRIAMVRHSPAGLAQLAALDAAMADKNRIATAKEAARAQLDQLMEDTFARYGTSINRLLSNFATQLSIVDMSISYRGAQARPRTDFALEVRGHRVELGSGSERASFGNALSEGDKRALAFSFFIARILNDPNLANRVIVIDDPMCSLDSGRRFATIRTLKKLAVQCRQLIVLAHDIWFLRDLDDSITKLPTSVRSNRRYVKIVAAASNWSDFDTLSLDAECQGPHQKNIQTLVSFIQDPRSVDKVLVARSVRPLVEGYLHRRFPLDVPRNQNLGTVINLIREARVGQRLAAALPLVQELQELNDYTIQFMHVEGEPAPDLTAINEAELLAYATRALSLVLA